MELIVLFIVICAIAAWAYGNGKEEGSRNSPGSGRGGRTR